MPKEQGKLVADQASSEAEVKARRALNSIKDYCQKEIRDGDEPIRAWRILKIIREGLTE